MGFNSGFKGLSQKRVHMVENVGENWSNILPNETSRSLLLCMRRNRNLV